MNSLDLKEYLAQKGKYVEENLNNILVSKEIYPKEIHEAMNYSVMAGGKRLRPILCLAAADAVGGNSEELIDVACALEIIHTYSLIHDDLPCMDNDDLRRGKPTNHIVFGEAIALLAGDGLLTYAFEVLSKAGLKSNNAENYLRVIHEISGAVGTMGMIGGQVVDIQSENMEIDLKTLEYIHKCKTAALIKTSVRAGAILGGGTKEQIDALTTYAENLGLAFQITDDLLDVFGDETIVGKNIGSDDKNNKATFPKLLGIDKTKEIAQATVEQAIDALKMFDTNSAPLKELAKYLLVRKN
ncbi:farnesyl-diphosphate synthase [Desulfonispora thiosulfatigenes DSM 11270]|uniref:Farnesyl diphosphate synthase n=1 Tax=Desulfonispora thiosulfatigenes DSM 11270 TaxID=656914 RepID=A0A1W1VNJ8_DESTI|nr:farnesyl diphosphate synthase [Desulfonispora thiosulfatigenes]SMB94896.1 farnesyl-diphosphate synthase [Desulfonispora thiosulfatigenes DSM 11270]